MEFERYWIWHFAYPWLMSWKFHDPLAELKSQMCWFNDFSWRFREFDVFWVAEIKYGELMN